MNSRLVASLTVLLMVAASPAAFAQTHWDQDHPRRTEVNKRLAHQNQRIRQERREGEISAQQARHLHQNDRQVRQEERMMAAQNGGHITRQEQRTLNQQENGVSREIGH